MGEYLILAVGRTVAIACYAWRSSAMERRGSGGANAPLVLLGSKIATANAAS
jgi:hypothetical protein